MTFFYCIRLFLLFKDFVNITHLEFSIRHKKHKFYLSAKNRFSNLIIQWLFSARKRVVKINQTLNDWSVRYQFFDLYVAYLESKFDLQQIILKKVCRRLPKNNCFFSDSENNLLT